MPNHDIRVAPPKKAILTMHFEDHAHCSDIRDIFPHSECMAAEARPVEVGDIMGINPYGGSGHSTSVSQILSQFDSRLSGIDIRKTRGDSENEGA